MAEQWLSIVEYARTFKVSDMTIRRRIKTGKLHAVLKDGKYYIPIPFSESGKRSQPVEIDDPSQGNYRYESAPARPQQEMQIIKAHPAASKTIVAPQETIRQHSSVIPAPEREEPRYSAVPQSLAEPLMQGEKSIVDSRALLAYCDATLKKMNEMERRTVERFKAKLDSVESTLALRDSEVRSLRQQVEDLQVLVRILEKKNGR
jgi:hypothetical protein